MSRCNPSSMFVACALVAGVAILGAQTPPPAAKAPPPVPPKKLVSTQPRPPEKLVERLIQMLKRKTPEPVIVKAWRESPEKLSAEDLMRMQDEGASGALLVTLSEEKSATPTRAPAPPPAPSVAPYNTDLSGLHCDVPASQRKRILAVKNFDFVAVKTTDQAILNSQSAIGTGMQALSVKRIQEAGKYRVVERENIQAVLVEQDFGSSSRTKQGTQARIGKILGADAILLGTITVFGPR